MVVLPPDTLIPLVSPSNLTPTPPLYVVASVTPGAFLVVLVTEPSTLILCLSFSIVTCPFFPIGILFLLSIGFGTGNFPSKGLVGFVEDISLLGFMVIFLLQKNYLLFYSNK